jgi:CCR4-NOT transcription complex subunit 6
LFTYVLKFSFLIEVLLHACDSVELMLHPLTGHHCTCNLVAGQFETYNLVLYESALLHACDSVELMLHPLTGHHCIGTYNLVLTQFDMHRPVFGLVCRYRIQSDRKVAICSVHPSEQATLQCLGCVKAKLPVAKSYHCSPKCFSDAWQHHRVLHDRAASAINENGNEEEELFGRFNSSGSGVMNASLSGSASSASLTNGSTPLYPAAVTQRSGGETWFEVGRSKTYTPSADDIGHVLKFECVVVDAETKLPVGHSNTLLTSRVIPAPSPTPRCLISVSGLDAMAPLDSDGRISSSGTFTVLSYNILSDVYATNDTYSYCPSWALSWPYRRQNLLREIVGYRADIVCLQEVRQEMDINFIYQSG